MKTEFLAGLGLEKDAIDKIMAENGKDIEALKNESTALKEQLTAANKTVVDANAEIEKFKSLDIDSIKNAADEWKKKAETAEKSVAQQQFDSALSAALTTARARSAKAVKPFLDLGALKLTDSGIVGLTEQLDAVKKEHEYLFNPAPAGGPRFGNQDPPDKNTNINQAMNDAIRGALGRTTL